MEAELLAPGLRKNTRPAQPEDRIQPSAGAKNEILASIILPAYNEAAALPKVLTDLFCVLDERYEVIVVDDGSTDGTAAIAGEHPCRVIRHRTNQGKGAAVRTGSRQARGTYVVIMDADATYPASAIPQLVHLLVENDVVRCIRRGGKDSMPAINQLGNRIFDLILARIGMDCGDHLSGLYGLRRDMLLEMDLESDGFDIEAEISIKARTRKLKAASFPIDYMPRLGEKKLRPWRDGAHILNRILFMLLLFNPIQAFILPGFVIMILGLAGAAALRTTSIGTPYFWLDVHSFILAMLGVLAGFELMIFGTAAALYAVEAGNPPRPWLIAVMSRRVRLTAAGAGLIFAILPGLELFSMTAKWLANGAGPFANTRELVLNAAVSVWGLQMLSAALFLSIFAGRLNRKLKDLGGARITGVEAP